jgi:hypothetical protein
MRVKKWPGENYPYGGMKNKNKGFDSYNTGEVEGRAFAEQTNFKQIYHIKWK